MVKKHVSSPELAQERSTRIKRLRKMLRYSRAKFAEKHEISYSSLQNWEDIRWYGLTESGAAELARAFQAEGLAVTIEWLMFGLGEDPLESSEILPFPERTKLSEQGLVTKELRLFHEHHADAVDTIITDNGLAPWLAIGDYVAGIRYFDNEMEKAINHPSIVQTSDGQMFIRIVKPGKDLGYYTLVCDSLPAFQDVQLLSAAPILWIRKLEIKK